MKQKCHQFWLICAGCTRLTSLQLFGGLERTSGNGPLKSMLSHLKSVRLYDLAVPTGMVLFSSRLSGHKFFTIKRGNILSWMSYRTLKWPTWPYPCQMIVCSCHSYQNHTSKLYIYCKKNIWILDTYCRVLLKVLRILRWLHVGTLITHCEESLQHLICALRPCLL